MDGEAVLAEQAISMQTCAATMTPKFSQSRSWLCLATFHDVSIGAMHCVSIGALHIVAWLGLAGIVAAQPTLTVSAPTANLSGNLEWDVQVTPDAALFSSTDLGLGSSLAVELAFEVFGNDLLDATVNAVDWTNETAGNNPFTGTATSGVSMNLANDTLFVSLTSEFFTAANPVDVLTIETDGITCTTLVWGGHTIFEGELDEYDTSRIAQDGTNFDGLEGSLTEAGVDGDFDFDCDVDGADFLEWQQRFGAPYMAADLVDWQTNYGTKAPLQAAIAVVPEPAAWILLACYLVGGQLQSRIHGRRFEMPSQRP